ncbi:M48 family metalloprotease [Kitasatospora sp. NPDC101801]|uniref:M48 family metalloprotease n=1 Tax=Kitasatospora sp. NPDC101801 TaxID=3364103 RepID=UPI0037FEA6FE
MGTPARPTGMSTAGRAALAVAMLVGFYLLAAGLVLGVLGADVALVVETGRLNPAIGKLILLSLAVAYPVLRVVFLTRRPRERGEAYGLPVTREQQPELWARVDRIAERTGVRGPAEIRLIPEVNAGVREDTKLLGLIPGKRHLVIGAPLLIGLTEAELDSVLAHEFGHYSNRDVRLAGVTVAGRSAILHTIHGLHARADGHQAQQQAELRAKAAKRLAKGKKVTEEKAGGGVDRALAKLFTQYAKLYFRVSESVSRRQEYAADRSAAAIAGRDATAAALRRLPLLDAAESFYLHRYATIGWSAGLLPMPGQVYGGLAELLADPKRRQELAELALEPAEEEADPYDSHPPIAQRVAAIEALPDDGRAAEGSGPALVLLHEAERTLAALESVCLVPEAATKRRVAWPELVQTVCLTDCREDCQPILTALTSAGLPGTVEALLDAIDAGRTWELAGRLPRDEQAVAPTGLAAREAARPVFRSTLGRLTVLALAESGRAHWEFSWSTAAVLHLPDSWDETFSAALDAAVADVPDTAPLRTLLTTAGPVPAAH